jgi:hypothetical protein
VSSFSRTSRAVRRVIHWSRVTIEVFKVHMIRMTGFGGLCLIETRRRARDAFVVYSAGLLAQAAVFVVTLVAIHWTDSIVPPLIEGFAFSLIGTNALLFLISLIPSTSPDGLNSDGRVLLRLARDRRDGKAFIGVQFEGTKQGTLRPSFLPRPRCSPYGPLRPRGLSRALKSSTTAGPLSTLSSGYSRATSVGKPHEP